MTLALECEYSFLKFCDIICNHGHVEFKNKCTFATLSCGLFLPCRGENRQLRTHEKGRA